MTVDKHHDGHPTIFYTDDTTHLKTATASFCRWGSWDVNSQAIALGVSAGEVSNNIVIAIEKVQSDFENQLTQEQQDEFENCKANLNNPTIELIDDVIERSKVIMIELGLYPG